MPSLVLPFSIRHLSQRELGKRGEARAALFYRLRGFRVVARNIRIGRGEIDLIVRRGDLVVFVEVKTRRTAEKGLPAEAVDRKKQLQIGALAESWCAQQRQWPAEIRFDVLSLLWRGWRFEVEHFAGAFELLAEDGRPWRRR